MRRRLRRRGALAGVVIGATVLFWGLGAYRAPVRETPTPGPADEAVRVIIATIRTARPSLLPAEARTVDLRAGFPGEGDLFRRAALTAVERLHTSGTVPTDLAGHLAEALAAGRIPAEAYRQLLDVLIGDPRAPAPFDANGLDRDGDGSIDMPEAAAALLTPRPRIRADEAYGTPVAATEIVWVRLCHRAQGAPGADEVSGSHELPVPAWSLPFHLAHGDALRRCPL